MGDKIKQAKQSSQDHQVEAIIKLLWWCEDYIEKERGIQGIAEMSDEYIEAYKHKQRRYVFELVCEKIHSLQRR